MPTQRREQRVGYLGHLCPAPRRSSPADVMGTAGLFLLSGAILLSGVLAAGDSVLVISGAVVDAANRTARHSVDLIGADSRLDFVEVHEGPAAFYFNAAAAEVLSWVRRSPGERYVAHIFVEALEQSRSPGRMPLVLEYVLLCARSFSSLLSSPSTALTSALHGLLSIVYILAALARTRAITASSRSLWVRKFYGFICGATTCMLEVHRVSNHPKSVPATCHATAKGA